MGEMASTLAHELNQPLSAIANYLKGSRRLLERQHRRDAGADARRHRQGRRAGAARRPDHPPPARFRRARREPSGGSRASRSWSRRRARWRWSAPRSTACGCASSSIRGADLVLADKVQIQQVLLNLIRNAIEAHGRNRRAARTGRSRPRSTDERHGRDQRRRYRPRHRAGGRRRSCSSRSSPPSGRAWASACRSRARSSRRMAARSGPTPNPGGGTVFRFTLRAVEKEEIGDAV